LMPVTEKFAFAFAILLLLERRCYLLNILRYIFVSGFLH
jgi:hypothetical protein